jgi:hypothetical protein
MTATIEQLQAAIARERAYQDAKWGTVQENPHSLAGWLLIAERELDEAIEAWIRKPGDREAKAELLQFVSVGYAFFEQENEEKRSTGLALFADYLEPLSPSPARDLEEWLGLARHDFSIIWWHLGKSKGRLDAIKDFSHILSMCQVALLQHGIVERGDL